MLRQLAQSYEAVQEDERPVKEAYAWRTARERAAYRPLHRWVQEPSPSLEAIATLLDARLAAGLNSSDSSHDRSCNG